MAFQVSQAHICKMEITKGARTTKIPHSGDTSEKQVQKFYIFIMLMTE